MHIFECNSVVRWCGSTSVATCVHLPARTGQVCVHSGAAAGSSARHAHCGSYLRMWIWVMKIVTLGTYHSSFRLYVSVGVQLVRGQHMRYGSVVVKLHMPFVYCQLCLHNIIQPSCHCYCLVRLFLSCVAIAPPAWYACCMPRFVSNVLATRSRSVLHPYVFPAAAAQTPLHHRGSH
jgi:hypothetical protein